MKNIIQSILEPRVIPCFATLPPVGRGTSVDLWTAAEIVRESKTCALVYHALGDLCSLEDVSDYTWSFLELLDLLPSKSFFLMANTSRAGNPEKAVEKALLGRRAFKSLPHPSEQLEPVIKLEVLDNAFTPDNAAVISATRTLTETYGMCVVPLIAPDIEDLIMCSEIRAPAVRILSGRIGSMSGLVDKPRLRRLASASPVPVIFEGGIATPDQVLEALELGASAVLMNTAFQMSPHPVELARSVRRAIDGYSKQQMVVETSHAVA